MILKIIVLCNKLKLENIDLELNTIRTLLNKGVTCYHMNKNKEIEANKATYNKFSQDYVYSIRD